jgi:branched-chain amino acid transport system substrate-binding protein
MKRRGAIAIAVSSLLVLTMGACSTSTRGSDKARAAVSGVTDGTITVGGLGLVTAASGEGHGDVGVGAKARFERANRDGGINGRKIKYVGMEDDAGDLAKNATAVRKLVQRDKVFAVVPIYSIALSGGAKFLQQNDVPYLGFGFLPEFCNQPYGFGFNGCNAAVSGTKQSTAYFAVLAKALGGANGKTIAMYSGDSPAGRTTLGYNSAGATAQGFKVVLSKPSIPQTSLPTDWTPYVHEVMIANGGKPADIVWGSLPPPANIGLFTALKAAGYKGVLYAGTGYDPKLLANPQSAGALDGAYVYNPIEPFESDNAQVQQMKDDIKAVAGNDVTFDADMAIGYATADLFVALATKAGKKLTPQSFVQAAKDGVDVNNVAGKTNYPVGYTENNSCGAMLKVVGTKFEVAAPLTCSTPVPIK